MIGLFVNRQRDSSGGVTLTPRPAAGIPVTACGQGLQGWAVASDGSSYSEELGSTPVPSTAIRSQGLAFTPDGALYTTVSAPTSTSAKIGGFAVRADGALHLADSNAVGATIQGIKVTADGRLITSAPWTLSFVTRYWDSRQGVTSSAERVSNWLDMKLGTDLAQASGAAQPILLSYGGANYLWPAGVAGNYTSAPDSAALSITGDIDCRFFAVLDDWTPGSISYLGGKYNTGGDQRSYLLDVRTNGTLGLTLSTNGAGTDFKQSTAAVPFANGTSGWVRYTVDVDNGAGGWDVKFYTSLDGSTWTQLGTTVTTAGSYSIFDSTALLNIGSYDNGTGVLAGRIYCAQIYNGIAGTLVFDANFTSVSEGATSFTESSSNAATVTINSAGAKPAQIIGRQWLLGDAAAYFMEAAFTNNAPYFVCAAVRFNTWASADVLFDGATANSFAAQQITGTPQIRMHDGSADTSSVSPTLKTRYILFASQAADGTTRFRLNLGAAVTGTLSATAMAGLSILGDGAGANNIGAQLAAIAQGDTQPTLAQEEQIIRAMASQSGVSV